MSYSLIIGKMLYNHVLIGISAKRNLVFIMEVCHELTLVVSHKSVNQYRRSHMDSTFYIELFKTSVNLQNRDGSVQPKP